MFCLSDDENFATIEWKNLRDNKCHLRVSLINIMLGDSVLYLITFDIREKRPEFVKVLRLQDMEGIMLTKKQMEGIQARFKKHIKETHQALRRIVVLAISNGIPVPSLSNALAYLDMLSQPKMGASLIQAQRDYFGAHTYERIDQEGSFHHEWRK